MLATLNLQLSPVELLDDNSLTPVSLAPGENGEAESGFADMLRVSVDTTMPPEAIGGDFLPPGGSELPIDTELLFFDPLLGKPPMPNHDPLLWKPKLTPGLIKLSEAPVMDGELAIHEEAIDLALETPVVYPSLIPETGVKSDSLILGASVTIAGPASTNTMEETAGTSVRPAAAIDLRHGLEGILKGNQPSPIPAPVIDGREARALNPAAEASVSAAVNLGLRERGQQGEPASRSAPITVTNTILDSDDGAALTDLARRFDLAPTQRTESATDALQARFAVAQAAQSSQGPASTQPVQSTLSLSSAAASDSGYASAAQQSTDLISTSVRDRAWGEQVGDRVVMMATNQLKQAEIRLTPAELGPLRVQVSVDDGNAHVTFHAQHAATREALEQALPRLRDLLAENGLSLGQADVSDRGVNDGGSERGSEGGALNTATDDATDIELEIAGESTQRATTSNGLVDTFA